MNRSELTNLLAEKFSDVPISMLEESVKSVFKYMIEAIARGERIEIRGFGCFKLCYRKSRIARNPKTGEKLEINGKYVLRFKPGKEMKDRVNAAA